MAKSQKLCLNLSRPSDKMDNDVNYISLGDLLALKKGLADTAPEMVVAVKKLLKAAASEAEIVEYLVKPFVNRT